VTVCLGPPAVQPPDPRGGGSGDGHSCITVKCVSPPTAVGRQAPRQLAEQYKPDIRWPCYVASGRADGPGRANRSLNATVPFHSPRARDLSRIDRSVCGQLFLPGVTLDSFVVHFAAIYATFVPDIVGLSYPPVRSESPLRCYAQPDAFSR
jgi:hypothetical protein